MRRGANLEDDCPVTDAEVDLKDGVLPWPFVLFILLAVRARCTEKICMFGTPVLFATEFKPGRPLRGQAMPAGSTPLMPHQMEEPQGQE